MDILKRTSLLMLLIVMATTMNAQQKPFKVNGIYYKYTDNTKTHLMVCAVPKDSARYTGAISIPSTVEFIDSLTFVEPKDTILPVIKIDNEAFRNSNITKITIAESILSIGSNAFSNCSKLNETTALGWNHLLNITFANEYSNPFYVTKNLYIKEVGTNEVKSLQIPDTVKTIQKYTFAGCEYLDSISIPASVVKIEDKAFLNCKNLKRARFASVDALCHISFKDKEANPLYYANHLYLVGKTQEETSITIPEGTTLIEAAAFAGCTEITKMTFYEGVDSIGPDAFYGCSNLYTVDYITSKTTNEATGVLASGIKYGNNNSNPMRFANQFLINGSDISVVSITEDISADAFNGAKWLEQVTIAENVKSIGNRAFLNCSNLYKVVFNNSQLTTIGDDAFNGCSSIENISLPNSLESIGTAAFRNCSKLGSITIPQNVTTLNKETFVGCTSLLEVDIRTNVTSIPQSMFKGCSQLGSITLTTSVETIQSEAFSGCAITKLPENNHIVNIRDNAFNNCPFKTLTLTPSIEYIGKQAFKTDSLTHLYIPADSKVNFIGENAFASSNLKYVFTYLATAPNKDNVNNVNQQAFGNNTTQAFLFYVENATGYNQQPWSSFAQGSGVFSTKKIIYYVDNDSTHCDTFQVGEKVTEWDILKEWAPKHRPDMDFSGWKEQIPAIMPNEELKIHGFFTKDEQIGSLIYHIEPTKTETKVVSVVKGVNYHIDVPKSIEFSGKTYAVTAIDSHAFSRCQNLQEVTLSDTIKHIGIGAFTECNQLKNITIPKSIESLADSLFYECTSLSSVTLPANLRKIGASAFNRCSSLSMDSLPAMVDSIGELAFCRSGISFITIPKGVKNIGERAFLNCEYLDSVRFETGSQITKLLDNTFQNCTRMKSFKLASATTNIGKGAFQNCSSISQLLIEEGVTDIGQNAFYGLTKLKNVTLPKSISNISNNAFQGCDSIVQITIAKGTPPSAAASAFSDKTYNSAALYVPVDAIDAYRNKSPWSRFGNRIQSIADNPLIYLVDGKLYGDTLTVRVGTTITPIPRPTKEGRAFKGWDNLPSVMPNDTVRAMGAFKYKFTYHNEDKLKDYSDSLFYGEQLPDFIEKLPQKLAREGYRYEIIDTVLTMPANDTIIRVKYYPTETDVEYADGLTYHVYTENKDGQNAHAEVIAGKSPYTMTNIIISDSIEYPKSSNHWYQVTAIRNDAFKNCQNLKSISLSDSISKIGTQSFRNCINLKEIEIPSSVKKLGDEIFWGCYKLREVHFEQNSTIDTLSATIFQDCKGLEIIELPSTLKMIARDAFRGCKQLKRIDIPQNVIKIGERAFNGCEKLDSIYILSTILPDASEEAFDSVTYDNATLYVSQEIQNNEIIKPWNNFKNREQGNENAEPCDIPQISYIKGELQFSCPTPNSKITCEVKIEDAKKISDVTNQPLTQTYKITVYAQAPGRKRSMKKATMTWRSVSGKLETEGFTTVTPQDTTNQAGLAGDINGDNKLTAEDAAIILRKLTIGKEVNNNNGK